MQTLYALLLTLLFGTPVFAANWTPLFNGRDFSGWTTLDGQPVPAGAWQIEDGVIHLDTSNGHGGHIVTDRDYGNFELVFEWKIAHKANSGIKYRVKDFAGRVLGCEYQIIDDVDYGGLRPAQTTAALYDLFEPMKHQRLRPVGEYSRGCIIVCGRRIEHYLNGLRVVTANVGDAAWNDRVARSKFGDVPGFGRNTLGRIMLTDHGDPVWYRNLFIRRLSIRR